MDDGLSDGHHSHFAIRPYLPSLHGKSCHCHHCLCWPCSTSTCPPVLDGFGQVASVLLGSRNLLPNWSQGVDLSSWALWAPAGSFQSCMGSARVGSRSLRLWHIPRATSHEPKQDSSDCGVLLGLCFSFVNVFFDYALPRRAGPAWDSVDEKRTSR